MSAAARFRSLPKLSHPTREQVAEFRAQRDRRAKAERAKADAEAIALREKQSKAKAAMADVDFDSLVRSARARQAALEAQVAVGKIEAKARHLAELADKPGPNRWVPTVHAPRIEPTWPGEDAAAIRATAVRGYLDEWRALKAGRACVVLHVADDEEETP